MLLLGLRDQGRTLLADCGDLSTLSHGVLRRVSDLLITHGHLDHLADFSRLLRARMGEHGGEIRVWGPPPIQRQVHGLLSGFAWNLLGEFPLCFVVHEVGAEEVGCTRYRAQQDRFAVEPAPPLPFREGLLLEEGGIRLRAALLDHGLPCLAYAVEERQHVQVDPMALRERGMKAGPWLGQLRRAIAGEATDETPIAVAPGRLLPLGELRPLLHGISPGKKVVWAVDLGDTPANRAALATIATGADLLYLEAAFLDEQRARAAATHHLTARQAGEIARQLRVKRFVPVHISSRHHSVIEQVITEALQAFDRSAS